MIWPLMACSYIAIGGAFASILMRHAPAQQPQSAFDAVAAFLLIIGTIIVWPTLLALTLTEGK